MPTQILTLTATRETVRATVRAEAERLGADATPQERMLLARAASAATTVAMEAPARAEISVHASIQRAPIGRGWAVSLVVDVDEGGSR
jgi:hypothetical protein